MVKKQQKCHDVDLKTKICNWKNKDNKPVSTALNETSSKNKYTAGCGGLS